MSALVSWPIALQTLRERMRSGMVITLSVLLALTELGAGHIRTPEDIFSGLQFLTRAFLLALTLALGAGLISEELESGHAQLVLLRPVSRAAYFGGRLVGAGLVLLGALSISWLVAVTMLLLNQRFTLEVLLALPLGFLWCFTWLAILAALSVIARGSMNVGWLLFAALIYGTLVATSMGIGTFASFSHREGGLLDQLSKALQVVLPYLRPQDPSNAIGALAQGKPADWANLLYDLLWSSASWLLGVWLLTKRELARRRA